MSFDKTSDRARRRAPRVLLYSHDTFGLGHLRRSRTIAGALTAADAGLSALIMTGSPVAGRFTFPERVDHIRLPGVTKLADGSYVSEALGLDIDETTGLRAGLIRVAAENFDPDLVIVDKEPTGFRGELLPTLEWLRGHTGARLVLGLRDVLDDATALAEEWDRKDATAAMARYYDDVWVYGLRSVYHPLAGLSYPASVDGRMHWTGYLRRQTVGEADATTAAPLEEPYILVTPGGGGDGAALVDQVLQAYEANSDLSPRARIIYGPFLSGETRAQFETRVAALAPRVEALGFDSKMENLIAGAEGVIAMGGYNTFCEILSFDKPAIIVPRKKPRLEQYIRAERAESLGLVRMLDPDRDGHGAEPMAQAIRALARQSPPSTGQYPGLLSGLDFITDRVAHLLATRGIQAAE
ncbi:MAG: glycosyltransferase [Pseudomonadota bacterium]